MEKVADQRAERSVAAILEDAGFSGVHKSSAQRLKRLPTQFMKSFAFDLARLQQSRGKKTIGLEDCYFVIRQRGEKLDYLLHFLQNHKSSKLSTTLHCPVVLPTKNSLKIPDVESADLEGQPAYVDNHLPLIKDALHFKTTQKRSDGDGVTKHASLSDDHVAVIEKNGLLNGETNENGPSKQKYPQEAGRSRYKLRNVSMDDYGEIYCQRSAMKRAPNASPPPNTYTNTLMSAFLSKTYPSTGYTHPKMTAPGSRGNGHLKNGIVSARADHRLDRFGTNASPMAGVSGCGDTRDLNGSYLSPRDDLPEVDEEEEANSSKIHLSVDDPAFKVRLNDYRARNTPPCEWANSPKQVPNSLSSVPLMATPLTSQTSAQSKPRKSLSERLDKSSKKDLSAITGSQSSHKVSKLPPKPSKRSNTKSNSRVKSKTAVNKNVNKSKLDSPLTNSQSKSQDRKRGFDELDLKSSEKIDVQLSVDTKTKVKEDVMHSGSRSKRRKVEATPESTPRMKAFATPEYMESSQYSPLPSTHSFMQRENNSQGHSSSNTPVRNNNVLSSDEEDRLIIQEKEKAASRASPQLSNKRRLSEWEDVPLSKRVPSIKEMKKDDSRSLSSQEAVVESAEDTQENKDNIVTMSGLKMTINLDKLRKDSASGTPVPTPETTQVTSEDKIEEEEGYEWVRAQTMAFRRRRSGSLSDGGDDLNVMRFRGPPGPSPPGLPYPDSVAVDLESDDRRTSTDSLPPPSLKPTVPLPKMKIKKIKGTNESFITTPADVDSTNEEQLATLTKPVREDRSDRWSKRRGRSRSSRSPSPPQLAPALTPPHTASIIDESAPTLTLVPSGDVVESVVLEQSDDETFVQNFHSQSSRLAAASMSLSSSTLSTVPASDSVHSTPTKLEAIPAAPLPKKSGTSVSKKKSVKRSSKSRGRQRPRPQARPRPQPPPSPVRSPTPPTPPAVLEPACEDLGFGFRSPSPSPPPPPPPPTVIPRPKSKSSRSTGVNSSTGSSSKKGFDASNTSHGSSATPVDVSGGASAKSKKAAISKSKTHSGSSKSTSGNAPTGGGGNAVITHDTTTELTSMGVNLSHGSSYYFDSNGIQIWICPTCHTEDNGSLMIGCDSCDDWYHGRCLNIFVEPDEDTWYCPNCVKKLKTVGPKRKKKGSKIKGRR